MRCLYNYCLTLIIVPFLQIACFYKVFMENIPGKPRDW